MKALIVIIMLVPACSYGQKFDVTEQGGYGSTNAGAWKSGLAGGFSNQVSFGYHPIKYFAVNVFFELNAWNSTNTSFGIAPDFTTDFFYAGVDLKTASIATYNYVKYNRSLGYGAHIGVKQHLFKSCLALEQMGYEIIDLLGVSPLLSMPQMPEYGHFSESLRYFYFRVGVCYSF